MKQIIADPDFITEIDRKSNIIICTPKIEGDSNIIRTTNFPNIYEINLARELNLSSDKITTISSNLLATTILPKIKICHPVGIKLQFDEFMEKSQPDVFHKIYRSFKLDNIYTEDTNEIDYHLITNIEFIIYFDTIRIRENNLQMLMNKDTRISSFYFTWYVQTKADMSLVKEIYLIQDDYIYEKFYEII